MKKVFLAVSFVVTGMMLLTACAGFQPSGKVPSAPPAVEGGMTFITGGEQDTYYQYGLALAQVILETNDTALNIVASDGSKENVEALQSGSALVGFAQSDVLSYAYEETRIFDDKADKISIVAELYKEQVQIITMNPAIRSVSDLKGKSVSIGANGSGVYFNAIDILEAYGLTEYDISPVYRIRKI